MAHKVREGRRSEFRAYEAFADEEAHSRIPDIQAESTFLACKLDWSDCGREPHASTLRLYRALLRLRRHEPALRSNRCGGLHAEAIGEDAMLLRHHPSEGRAVSLAIRLRGAGGVDLPGLARGGGRPWTVLLTTEDTPYAPDPMPDRIELAGPRLTIVFERPGAVLLGTAAEGSSLAASAAAGRPRPRTSS